MTDSVSMSLLSRIERREMELLGWGVIDGSFAWDEVREMAVSLLEERGLESSAYPEEFINDLLARRLLYQMGCCRIITGHGWRKWSDWRGNCGKFFPGMTVLGKPRHRLCRTIGLGLRRGTTQSAT